MAGLTANTTYHVRVTATNSQGTSHGGDIGFKTARKVPLAEVEAPSSVSRTSAELNGSVNPSGSQVKDCHFQYGSTEAYGTSVPCSPSPGSGLGFVQSQRPSRNSFRAPPTI